MPINTQDMPSRLVIDGIDYGGVEVGEPTIRRLPDGRWETAYPLKLSPEPPTPVNEVTNFACGCVYNRSSAALDQSRCTEDSIAPACRAALWLSLPRIKQEPDQ